MVYKIELLDFYVKSYFKLNDTSMDKLELEIGWIMKDNVKGNSIELIKKYNLPISNARYLFYRTICDLEDTPIKDL